MESKTEENSILKQLSNDLDLHKLKALLDSPETCCQATEAVAELAKAEKHRQTLTEPSVIAKLLELLKDSNPEQVALAIRALANICYENDKAANMTNEANVENIIALFKNPLNLENNTLINNVSVLLINLFHGNDNLPIIVLTKHNILSTIEQLLCICLKDRETHETLLEFLLSILHVLIEYLQELDMKFTDTLQSLLVTILRNYLDSPKISSLCLDMLQILMDLDLENIPILVKAGACEVFHEIGEKERETLGEEIYKQAGDLLTIALTDDVSMDILYEDGKGQTYKNMVAWLDSEDPELLSTGILAMGNFARKDSNCIQMVKNGISKKLINLLHNYNTSTKVEDVKIQHAILSTLKNLAIPKENKSQIIEENIVDALYPMIKEERSIIVYKLLGTFRMIIDGQEKISRDLLSRKDFIEWLGYSCYCSDHIGVRGEVPRIIAWLVKNSHSSENFSAFLEYPNSIKCLVEMISSNHAIMQNEAYFALLMLAKGFDNTSIEKYFGNLVEAPVGKHLSFALNTYGKKWDEHTFQNHLSLVKYLIQNGEITENLKENNYFNSLSSFETKISRDIRSILEKVELET